MLIWMFTFSHQSCLIVLDAVIHWTLGFCLVSFSQVRVGKLSIITKISLSFLPSSSRPHRLLNLISWFSPTQAVFGYYIAGSLVDQLSWIDKQHQQVADAILLNNFISPTLQVSLVNERSRPRGLTERALAGSSVVYFQLRTSSWGR